MWNVLLQECYIAPPEAPDDSKKNADDSSWIWSFLNCIGSCIRKHIVMDISMRYYSSYFNYKGTHSIVLMTACDSHYCIISATLGFHLKKKLWIYPNYLFYQTQELILPSFFWVTGWPILNIIWFKNIQKIDDAKRIYLAIDFPEVEVL